MRVVLSRRLIRLFSRPSRYRTVTTTTGTTTTPSELSRIRTVGISAHIDAGKTTTTERMLLAAGAIKRCGTVDGGDTVTDYLPAERERGITIKAAAVTFAWRGAVVNLIDTPGHVDFTIEVERSLRVLDGVVALFDAVSGVEAQTETVWAQAARYGVARIGFVNKMDRDGASYEGSAAAITSRLGAVPLLIHVPVGSAGGFAGVVDLLTLDIVAHTHSSKGGGSRAAAWRASLLGALAAGTQNISVPGRADGDGPLTVNVAILAEAAREGREALLVTLADADDAIAEAYLAAGDAAWDPTAKGLTPAHLKAAIRKLVCTPNTRFLPLLCGASAADKGVDGLLDAIVDFLPSPLDKPPIVAEAASAVRQGQGQGLGRRRSAPAPALVALPASAALVAGTALPTTLSSPILVHAKSDGPMRALAFKVQNHPSRGPLVFFRVYAGVLTRALALHNTSTGVKERPTKLLQLFADELREVDTVGAGCIGAASGLKSVRTGDTLCHEGDIEPVVLARVVLPAPVFSVALETSGAGEARALDDALALLLREDPSLTATTHPETGQLLLSGMGELHLDVAADRLKREFGVSGLTLGRVQVAQRESPTREASGAFTFDRLVAGKRAVASVSLHLAPCAELAEADACEFDALPEGELTCAYVRQEGAVSMQRLVAPALAAALHEGVAAGFGRGPLVGAPLSGLRVFLDTELTQFTPDSTPAAVRAATARALDTALRAAAVELREPLMNVRITLPGASVGDVLNDLTGSRHARVLEVGEEDINTTVASSSVTCTRRALIRAQVPLREMVGYATSLRSRTAGEAAFSMELVGFSPVAVSAHRST